MHRDDVRDLACGCVFMAAYCEQALGDPHQAAGTAHMSNHHPVTLHEPGCLGVWGKHFHMVCYDNEQVPLHAYFWQWRRTQRNRSLKLPWLPLLLSGLGSPRGCQPDAQGRDVFLASGRCAAVVFCEALLRQSVNYIACRIVRGGVSCQPLLNLHQLNPLIKA